MTSRCHCYRMVVLRRKYCSRCAIMCNQWLGVGLDLRVLLSGQCAQDPQIVVTQARRQSRNGGKLVTGPHQSTHNTMLAQYHGDLRGHSMHAAEASARVLGCSPLCLKLNHILCITSVLLDFFLSFFLGFQRPNLITGVRGWWGPD